MAIVGGLVLLLLIALTCTSVAGRLLNSLGHGNLVESHAPWAAVWLTRLGPINGDFELVENGIAFAIFCFFPWCLLNRAHARVDIVSTHLPRLLDAWLGVMWDCLFAGVLAVISWRLFIGMSDKRRYQETTFLLELPVWWGYALCAAASVVATVLALYMAYVRVQQVRGVDAGLPLIEDDPPSQGVPVERPE
jgi:hypothetical protein